MYYNRKTQTQSNKWLRRKIKNRTKNIESALQR